MLDSKDSIYAAQLAVYAAFNLPAFYVMIKHGLSNLHAWFFVWAFTNIRICGAALLLHSDLDGTTTEAGSIMYNVALAPLVFALSGVIGEASLTVAHRNPHILGKHATWATHGAVVLAIVLMIVGAVNVIGNLESGQPEGSTNISLIQAGVSLFLVIVFAISSIAFYSYRQPRNVAKEQLLITAAVICTPLLVLRVLYSFLGAVINSSSWSFLNGGNLAEQLALDVVPEFIIVTILVGAGFFTQDLQQEREMVRTQRSDPAAYSLVGQVPKQQSV